MMSEESINQSSDLEDDFDLNESTAVYTDEDIETSHNADKEANDLIDDIYISDNLLKNDEVLSNTNDPNYEELSYAPEHPDSPSFGNFEGPASPEPCYKIDESQVFSPSQISNADSYNSEDELDLSQEYKDNNNDKSDDELDLLQGDEDPNNEKFDDELDLLQDVKDKLDDELDLLQDDKDTNNETLDDELDLLQDDQDKINEKLDDDLDLLQDDKDKNNEILDDDLDLLQDYKDKNNEKSDDELGNLKDEDKDNEKSDDELGNLKDDEDKINEKSDDELDLLQGDEDKINEKLDDELDNLKDNKDKIDEKSDDEMLQNECAELAETISEVVQDDEKMLVDQSEEINESSSYVGSQIENQLECHDDLKDYSNNDFSFMETNEREVSYEKTVESNVAITKKTKRVVVKSQDKSYTRKVEQDQKNDLKIELQLNNKRDILQSHSLNKVGLHDDQDELDYNEDLDDEISRNRGVKELEEEGEIAGDDDYDDRDSDLSSDGELEDDDDCEEGEIKETDDFMPITKPICKFFTKGTCSWGNFCKFIHPAPGELGNYSLIERGNNNSGDNWNESRENVAPVEDSLPPPPPPATPPLETAWERGLRHAKEMKKKAKKRKENDASSFEEKRLNLNLEPSKDDQNKENTHKGHWKNNLHENVSDDDVEDEYYGVSKRVIHNRHDRNLDDDLRTYQLERRYHMPGREVEIHRAPTSPAVALEQDRVRPFRDHRDRENRLLRNPLRGRGNRPYSPIRHHHSPTRNVSPVRKYAASPNDNRIRRKRYISPYLDNADKTRNNRIAPVRNFGGNLRTARADEWTDPWQRTKSPKRTTRRSASRSRSRGRRRYRSSSGGSSSSYSSSSYSGSSRSRSRSYSSSSSYSSRSSRSGSSSYSSGSSRSRSTSPKRTVKKPGVKTGVKTANVKMVPFIKKEEAVDPPPVVEKTKKTASVKTSAIKPVTKVEEDEKVNIVNKVTLKPSPFEKNVLHSTTTSASLDLAKSLSTVNSQKESKKISKDQPAIKTSIKTVNKVPEVNIVPEIVPKIEDGDPTSNDANVKKLSNKIAKNAVSEKISLKKVIPPVSVDAKDSNKIEKSSLSFPVTGKGQKQIRSRKKERSSSESSTGSSKSGSHSSSSKSRSRSRSYSSRSSSSSSSGSADSDHLYRDISPVNKKEAKVKIKNGEEKSKDPNKKSKSHSAKGESRHKKLSISSGLTKQAPLQNGNLLLSSQGLHQNASIKKAADPLKILGQKSNIKLTLSNKATEKATTNVVSKKRAAPVVNTDAVPAKKTKIIKETKIQAPVNNISKPEKPVRPSSPVKVKEESMDTAPVKPTVPKKAVEPPPTVSNTVVNTIVSNKIKKSSHSRREELLKQLKAVEDAIAKKRSKMVPTT